MGGCLWQGVSSFLSATLQKSKWIAQMTQCQLHFHLFTVLLLWYKGASTGLGPRRSVQSCQLTHGSWLIHQGAFRWLHQTSHSGRSEPFILFGCRKHRVQIQLWDDCHLGGRGLLKPTGLSLRENWISSAAFSSHFRLFKRFISYSLSSWMAEK